jgi:exopolysaccharide biosynthesis operon protein EpsL
MRSLKARRLCSALITVGALAPISDAAALWDDRLELFVSERVTRDDNVFRISDRLDPAVALGSPSKADTYQTTSFGFNFNIPVSRQRFQGGVTWNDIRYNRFTILNLTGRTGQAAWLWQAGNDLSGRLEYTESLALASLANIQSGVQSSTPNPLLTRRGLFNAAYRLTPSWRLDGELIRLERSNEARAFQVNDVTIDSAGGTVSYISPAGNQIGVGYSEDRADYPNPQTVAGTLVSNAYRQQNPAIVAEWTPAGHSRINVRAGRVSRSYDQLPQRDYHGPALHAAYEWKPTGKLTLTASAQKDISATEEVATGFVLVKSAALRPFFRMTEKTSIGGNLEYADRDYRSDPGTVLGTVAPREDKVRTAALVATYQPTRTIRLELYWTHETRTSTFAFGDYQANIIGVSARLGL